MRLHSPTNAVPARNADASHGRERRPPRPPHPIRDIRPFRQQPASAYAVPMSTAVERRATATQPGGMSRNGQIRAGMTSE